MPPRTATREASADTAVASAAAKEGALDMDMWQLKNIVRYAFERFDTNSDGKISLEEFMAACQLLSLNASADQMVECFYELSEGRTHILQDDAAGDFKDNLLEKLGAMGSSWYESGLGKGAYILNSFLEALKDDKLPLLQRVQRGMEALPTQGILLTEFLEFVVPSVLLLDKLKCFPDCSDVDPTDIVPLVALLWRSMNEMASVVKDQSTFDLDEKSAAVFATAFKPAGFTVAGFQQLLRQSDARWVTLPKGARVDMERFRGSVAIVGCGQVRIQEDSVAPRLAETNVELGPGAFIGTSSSLSGAGEVSAKAPWAGRGKHMVADDEVVLLEFKTEALRAVLDVNAEARSKFQSAFVKSTVKTMSLACAQSKKIALELPSFFCDVLSSMKQHFSADRASVWIHDRQQKQLWTLFVKDDGSASYYGMPDSAGLAGHAFSRGQAVSIPDCYKDSRFNVEADRSTGYRTKSMLCVPIRGERGVEGVIQLINKTDVPGDARGGSSTSFTPFSSEDEAKANECMWQINLVVKQLRERYHSMEQA